MFKDVREEDVDGLCDDNGEVEFTDDDTSNYPESSDVFMGGSGDGFSYDSLLAALDGLGGITALSTGQLPPKEPILKRRKAYCGTDFKRRVVAWFTEERRYQVEEDAKREGHRLRSKKLQVRKMKRQSALPSPPPNSPVHVQPHRLAKEKRPPDDSDSLDSPLPKRQRTSTGKKKRVGRRHARPPPPLPNSSLQRSDYQLKNVRALGRVMNDRKVDTLWDGITAILAEKEDELMPMQSRDGQTTARDRWRQEADPGPVALHGCNEWCPILGKELCCTDMAYCLHGIDRPAGADVLRNMSSRGGADMSTRGGANMSTRGGADMSTTGGVAELVAPPRRLLVPPARPKSGRMTLRKRAALQRHIIDRRIEMFGLKFAVDTCNSSTRVIML